VSGGATFMSDIRRIAEILRMRKFSNAGSPEHIHPVQFGAQEFIIRQGCQCVVTTLCTERLCTLGTAFARASSIPPVRGRFELHRSKRRSNSGNLARTWKSVASLHGSVTSGHPHFCPSYPGHKRPHPTNTVGP
jgi:hypothetical protein